MVDWNVFELTVTAATTTGLGGWDSFTLHFAEVPQIIIDLAFQDGKTQVENLTDGASLTGLPFVVAATSTTIQMDVSVAATVQVGDIIKLTPWRRGCIYFPLGCYKLTAPITFPSETLLNIFISWRRRERSFLARSTMPC